MRIAWPELDVARDQPTFATLHLVSQMLGKLRVDLFAVGQSRLERHAPPASRRPRDRTDHGRRRQLRPDARPVPPPDRADRQRRPPRCRSRCAPRASPSFTPTSWRCSTATACRLTFHGRPSEIADALPFADDHAPRAYDPASAERLRDALALIVPIFERFRAGFRGKASPVHFFWGAFDLAVTRFSGHAAPPHPGGVPGLPDRITREAYSHEVSSAGFWAGGVTPAEPIFYSYAYPEPLHFRDADDRPRRGAASTPTSANMSCPMPRSAPPPIPPRRSWSSSRRPTPRAADLGHWDRPALERAARRAIAKGRGDRSPRPFG